MTALVVGQKLYRFGRDSVREYTVTKIGRKWATLIYGDRCTIDGLILDQGRMRHPRLYVSEEAYKAEHAVQEAWHAFKNEIGRNHIPPADITVEAINQARALLMLDGVK